MPELGPLGLQPHDKGIGAFPTFPSYSLANMSQLTESPSSTDWLTGATSDAPDPASNNDPSNADPSFGESGFGEGMGLGSLSLGSAASAFGSGAVQGLSGYGMGKLGDLMGFNGLGLGGKLANLAAKTAARSLGVPGFPAFAIDTLGGGVRGLVDAARNSSIGPRSGLPSLSDTVRGMFGNDDPTDPTGLIGFNGDLSFEGNATPDFGEDLGEPIGFAAEGNPSEGEGDGPSGAPGGDSGGPTGSGDAGTGDGF